MSCQLLPGLLSCCGDSGDCGASPAGLAGCLCSKLWPHSCHWCQCQGLTPDGFCRWGWARPPGPAFQDRPKASTLWLQGPRLLLRVLGQLHGAQKRLRPRPPSHHWPCALKSPLYYTLSLCSSVLNGGGSVLPNRWLGGCFGLHLQCSQVPECVSVLVSERAPMGGWSPHPPTQDFPRPQIPGLASSRPFSVSKCIFQTGPSPRTATVANCWVTSTAPAPTFCTESEFPFVAPTEGELSSSRAGLPQLVRASICVC